MRNFLLACILFMAVKEVDIKIFLSLSIIFYVISPYLLNIGVANLATAANMALGVLAVYYTYSGNAELGAILILFAVIFDGLDGSLARKFDKNKPEIYKKKGIIADDIGDGVTFGIATSAIIYFYLHNIFITLFYLACIIFRLWHFTKNKEKNKSGNFQGLPSPAGAMSIVMAGVLLRDYPNIFLYVCLGISILSVSFFIEWLHFKTLGSKKPIRIIGSLCALIFIYSMSKHEYAYAYPFLFANIAYIISPLFKKKLKEWLSNDNHSLFDFHRFFPIINQI